MTWRLKNTRFPGEKIMKPAKMLVCGCVANATKDGKPYCGIHGCGTLIDLPNIEGREAKCGSCGAIVPSAFNLPFFQFRGEDSDSAKDTCVCGYGKVAHNKIGSICKCPEFKPHGAYPYDSYYCGCRGWD